jgi:N-acetylmuramoyl-L-alanine amidase
MGTKGIRWGFGVVWFLSVLSVHRVHAEPRILGIRHWSAPSSTRVVVDLSEEVVFHDFRLNAPPRLVVDLPTALLDKGGETLTIQDGIVQKVRTGMHSPQELRIVLDLEVPNTQHQVFLLPKIQDKPYRLVIHVDSPEKGEQIAQERLTVQKDKVGKALVVVIDPGHGGEDPGAIGPRGTREKDVVLAIAKALEKRLNRNPGFRAFLTRTGDYFLSLRQRAATAHDYGADFFISIHADSSPSKSTRGASVYCLSLNSATDEAARILAERENASDLVGGVHLDGDWNLNSILLDLVQTQTINESLKWGGMVLGELEKVHGLKFPAPRQAGFRVLKAPDIPSILVEVGFITNREEESLLRSSAFQERVALALQGSVCRFLLEQRSVQQDHLVYGSCGTKQPQAHVVQPGQNLSQIALLYNANIREIQRVNELKDVSRIYPGQKLIIP